MPAALKPLAQVSVGNTATLVYQCPSQPPNSVTKITTMWMANTDSAQRLLTLRKGTGTLTAAANGIMEAVPMPGNTTWAETGGPDVMILGAGEKLEATADVAAKIVITLGGEETTS